MTQGQGLYDYTFVGYEIAPELVAKKIIENKQIKIPFCQERVFFDEKLVYQIETNMDYLSKKDNIIKKIVIFHKRENVY